MTRREITRLAVILAVALDAELNKRKDRERPEFRWIDGIPQETRLKIMKGAIKQVFKLAKEEQKRPAVDEGHL